VGLCDSLVGGVQSPAKVRVKGRVAAGTGLSVGGRASASLETSGRSALAAWGRGEWEATVLVCWERQTPAWLCYRGGGAFVLLSGFSGCVSSGWGRH